MSTVLHGVGFQFDPPAPAFADVFVTGVSVVKFTVDQGVAVVESETSCQLGDVGCEKEGKWGMIEGIVVQSETKFDKYIIWYYEI